MMVPIAHHRPPTSNNLCQVWRLGNAITTRHRCAAQGQRQATRPQAGPPPIAGLSCHVMQPVMPTEPAPPRLHRLRAGHRYPCPWRALQHQEETCRHQLLHTVRSVEWPLRESRVATTTSSEPLFALYSHHGPSWRGSLLFLVFFWSFSF